MPELPEVETIRRDLLEYLSLPVVIRNVQIFDKDFFIKHSNVQDESELLNKVLESIDRHGKKLIFTLDIGFLVFHLGMSGQIVNGIDKTKYPQHIKLMLELNDKTIYYVDIRKFGSIRIYTKNEKNIVYYGLDPINNQFSQKDLSQMLRKNRSIKSILMDQHIIAGIGNIYANEILFCAGINPHRKGVEVSEKEVEKLYDCVKKVLKSAIENYGTTFSIYRNLKGREGNNSRFLQVYKRDGKECYRCGAIIQRSIIEQRSTFFCPECQK